MPYFIDDPRHWRERAAEARKIAEKLVDPAAQASMQEIVLAYERMAERASRSAAMTADVPAQPRPPLQFPRQECSWDFDRRTVNFWGRAGEKPVLCRIAGEALRDHFHLDGEGNAVAQEAFASSRERILSLAMQKWQAGALEADGSVLLRSQDF